MGVSGELESTYAAGTSTDVPLATYLARPILISSTTFTVGTRAQTASNPWLAWQLNPQVRKRLEGFRHYRGKLKVRAVINGNPMLFGDVIMAWEPRASRSMHATAPITSRASAVQLSQQPHVYLNPTTSEGGELELPFFCPENWLDTANSQGHIEMGTLRIRSLAPLRHANANSGKCTINLFCWMEDAEVCTPTAAGYSAYSYQSNSSSEYASSPVSKTASAIAKGAGMLSHIPYLAPYAMATEMAASAVGKIAHIFGFSRPQVLDNPSRYREQHVGQLATVDTHELVNRLSYESKGQLTIDPRSVGLNPVDEMTISGIAQRECIVDTFDWSETDNTETVLRRINISPVMFNRDSTVSPNRAAFSPMMFASLPFVYWRGTIILRFKVMASALHRGRLRISYDPAGATAVGGYNEVYSRIVDIQTNKDVEVPIEWHATAPWLRCHKPDLDSTTDTPFATTLAMDPEFYNGQITVSVLNDLTSPDDTLGNVVTILTHARAGDDIEFAAPSDFTEKYTFRDPGLSIEPQSAFDEQEEHEENAPVGGKELEAIGDVHMPYDSHLNKVFFGEAIPSLRTLARRYTSRESASNSTFTLNRAPVDANGITLIEYIMCAFAGWRGSMRYKFVTGAGDVRIAASFYGNGTSIGARDSGITGIFYNRGAMEVEAPYYSIKRFEHTRTNPDFAADTDTRGNFSANQQGVWYTGSSGSFVFQAAGEDFTCFFFIGAPLFYSVI